VKCRKPVVAVMVSLNPCNDRTLYFEDGDIPLPFKLDGQVCCGAGTTDSVDDRFEIIFLALQRQDKLRFREDS
jgi:hypothetical protein